MHQHKEMELDVDFIGGHEPLTKDEGVAISAFIKRRKEKTKIKPLKKGKEKASV